MNKLLARMTLGLLAAQGLGVALAQEPDPAECGGNQQRRGRRALACDVRELTLPATGSLAIVDRTNGDIRVRAWASDEVHVRALVRATARELEVAREIAASVVISAEGNEVRASGPEWRGNQSWAEWRRNESWTVDYEVQMPRETELTVSAINGEVTVRELSGDVTVDAVNGEIAINDVSGDISAEVVNGDITVSAASGAVSVEAVNGSIELEGVSGDVEGEAVNGSIEVTFVGERLGREGIDLTTVNGPVDLRIPRGMSARLELVTVTGRIDADVPGPTPGGIPRRISTSLGGGGPPVRVETTGGSISVERY